MCLVLLMEYWIWYNMKDSLIITHKLHHIDLYKIYRATVLSKLDHELLEPLLDFLRLH